MPVVRHLHWTIYYPVLGSRGGFPSLRHNEVRDLTARLLTEVCNDVQIEPELQEITTEVIPERSANAPINVKPH